MDRRRRRSRAVAGVTPFRGGIAGFIRWAYPGLWFPLTLPIASEFGALAAHRAPEVGQPAFGAVYGPLLFFHWWVVQPRTGPIVTALAVGCTTFAVSAILLLSVEVTDFEHGRDWGWWQPVVSIAAWWGDLMVYLGPRS